MTETPEPPSPQTAALLGELAGYGFVADSASYGVRPDDGLVCNAARGVTVHADADVVRVIVAKTAVDPEYRWLLVRHGLSQDEALRIAGAQVRRLLAGGSA